jgi:glucose-1-phosphate thymidylyltransferase
VNAYLAAGGEALGVKAGVSYVDVGTLHGYRSAIGLLAEAAQGDGEGAAGARVALGWPAGRLAQGVHDVNRECEVR